MGNNFISLPVDAETVKERLKQIEEGKVGLYSVGLYPLSLAYNCVMQERGENLLLAPRPGRELFGAFTRKSLSNMNKQYLDKIETMATFNSDNKSRYYTLKDLIEKCELIILSSNSRHIEEDIKESYRLKKSLARPNVVIACLVGSFCFDNETRKSYLICQKDIDLAFFSGFHRHGALLNPADSFTANFCHPDALTSFLGGKLLDRLSPNIQVSSGVHNLEGQYIKAAKNISSIFAGFAHSYHKDNPGLLPTILTILLDQCLEQAASVSMSRIDRDKLYSGQLFPLTELGYGVQRIEASLLQDGNLKQVRDHTFTQLNAMVADVRGSMMLPTSGKPTRNFQAGQVLAENIFKLSRGPENVEEFIKWCEDNELSQGGLEGLNSLRCWPEIRESYSIPLNISSMINLLYMFIFGEVKQREIMFDVMTKSRQLANYCQVSTMNSNKRNNIDKSFKFDNENTMRFIFKSLSLSFRSNAKQNEYISKSSDKEESYIQAISIIETYFKDL